MGKTVFLKLMLGVLRPSSGHVFFRGEDLVEWVSWSSAG